MAIVDSTYASVAEADTFLGETLPWEDAEAADKQTALEWATVYMNDTYSIALEDGVATPTSLKNANALLANEHLTQNLFTTAFATAPQVGVTLERVVAGDVESETRYDSNWSRNWIDPFPQISALLAVAGYSISKGGLGQPQLVRT